MTPQARPLAARFPLAPAPAITAGLAFLVLFWQPIWTLGRDWWSDPDAGHGLLLAPLAVYLAWRRGRAPGAESQPALGLAILAAAVALRYLSGLAAEMFTMRLSLLAGVAGLIVFGWGMRQMLHWWLPSLLVLLSVPIPSVVLNSLAFPLQLKASEMGAALLRWRNVPIRLAGNVLMLPGQSLFVTEACSGLRSLTALLSLGVLVGGLWLRTLWSRLVLVAVAIPIAMVLNGLRVFLTGFFVYYVDPGLGEGVMHYTEGWFMFMIAFATLGVVGWILGLLERIGSATPA
ncbi:MAG: exosortase/archaeosortase family protein [Gemmatimonadales bacterium]|nr:exosortase/archaeosortase family protein [Gemmatimonadales bacterium]